MLAEHLLAAILRRLGRGKQVLPREQMDRLIAHDWPGNVRELQNVIEYAAITAGDGEPICFDLPRDPIGGSSAGSASGTGILAEAQQHDFRSAMDRWADRWPGRRSGTPGRQTDHAAIEDQGIQYRDIPGCHGA